MFCPSCGKQNHQIAKFCTGCGAALPETAPEPVFQEFSSDPYHADTVPDTQPEIIAPGFTAPPPPAATEQSFPERQPVSAGLHRGNSLANIAWAPLPPAGLDAARNLRPKTLAEIFDVSFALLWKNLPVFICLSAMLVVPVYLIEIFSQYLPFGSELDYLEFAYLIFTGIIVSCAMVKISSDAILEIEINLAAALLLGLRKFFLLFFTGLIFAAAIAAGLIFFTIPGLYWLADSFFWLHAAALEDRSLFRAFNRSRHLVTGSWWLTFSTILLGMAFLFVPPTLVSIGIGLFSGLMSSGTGGIIATSLNSIIMLFVIPVLPAITTVFYYDLRVRKDGLDIELSCEELWN